MSFEFDFTLAKLTQIIPKAAGGVEPWYDELYELLPTFEIVSVARVAAFLAQTAHESGGYTALKENLNYKADTLRLVWPKRFPDQAMADRYARKPEMIANYVYASRMGNGDASTGDGFRYRGRGLIQLTGQDNYKAFSNYANIDIKDAPAYIETPRGAIHSACWFWDTNKLNAFADAGNFLGMTKRINGGTVGLEDRIKKYDKATKILEA